MTSDPPGRRPRWYGSRGDRPAVRLYVFGRAGGGRPPLPTPITGVGGDAHPAALIRARLTAGTGV